MSLPSLSLIGSPATEIYSRTGLNGNTDRQTDTHRHTHTQTESDTPPCTILGIVKIVILSLKRSILEYMLSDQNDLCHSKTEDIENIQILDFSLNAKCNLSSLI